MTTESFPVDTFIGSVLNISGFTINNYPLSFIVWNIVLATLAVLAGRWAAQLLETKRNIFAKIGAVIVWLALLPNTAYLMTDARHIVGYCPLGSYGNVCPENAWMVLVFFAYAALGWPAFVLSLRPIVSVFKRRFGEDRAFGFITLMCLITSIGVLLGLLDRLNSWELVTRPLFVLQSAYAYIDQLTPFVNWIITSIVLLVLYFIGERIFIKPVDEK